MNQNESERAGDWQWRKGHRFIAVGELYGARTQIEERESIREGRRNSHCSGSMKRSSGLVGPRAGSLARGRGSSAMLGEARACREMAKTGLWRCVGARGRVNWGKVKRAAQISVGGGARQWQVAVECLV